MNMQSVMTGASVLAVALLTCPGGALAAPAQRQAEDDADQSGPQGEADQDDRVQTVEPTGVPGASPNDIIVTGIRGSLAAAAREKRDAKQIKEVIVSEDVGKLPDNNVPEALSRVTGVQIDRARGEGVGVTIRGLSDIQTTINGNNTNLGSQRSLNLADIPAELLKAVEVYKTRTADQVEGGIGGTVNVELRRPLDLKKGLTVAGSLRGSYNDIADKVSPYASLLLSQRFDTGIGEIGLLANLSYTRNNYFENYVESETPEPLRVVCCTQADGSARPGSLLENVSEQGLLDVVVPYRAYYGLEKGYIERPSVNLAAQWQATDRLDFVIEGTYLGSKERRQVDRIYLFTRDAGVTSISDMVLQPDGVTAKSFTVTGANGLPGGIDSLFNDIKSDLYTTNVEAHWRGDRAQINASVQYNWSNEGYYFTNQILRFPGVTTATIDFDSPMTPGGGPFIDILGVDLTDIESYGVERFQDNEGGSENKEFAAQVDLTLRLSENSLLRSLQSGFRFNTRDAFRYYGYRDGYPRINGGLAPLSTFPGADEASLISPEIDGAPAWLRVPGEVVMDRIDDVLDYIRQYDPDNAAFAGDRPPSDRGQTFTTKENTFAVYGQLNYGFDVGFPVDGVAGVRVVNTWGKVDSFEYRPDTTGENGGRDIVREVTGRGNYVDILPSINAILHFTPKLQLRLAYTFNVQRPGFYDLRPFAFIETRANPPIVFAGNPDLVAQTETNYDVSLEYFFGRAGQISIAGFIKKPKDFLYYSSETEDLRQYGLEGIGFVEQLRNAGDGEFIGIEAAAQSFFDFLPAPWRNFGASVNFTYIPRFRVEYPFDEETAAIPGVFDAPGTSKYTFNAAFYYDTARFSTRIAYNYRSERRDFVLTQNPGYSPYTDATSRLDAAINYTPVKFMTLSLEGTNLLGANTERYFGAARYLPLGVRVEATTVQASVRFRF